MANTLTATLDAAKTTLTVVGNYSRVNTVAVSDRGTTASVLFTWPLSVVDSSGHAWTLKGDDGTTAIYSF